ncbi:MAG TPA: tRNA uridine-5-carboxymethylaminomethyl(34) synthesis GTPase MnmE [Blastocatellia bacterium]|nr:tRNA uridine-5-carboxymethylaminomethyl(34) synthesis GTPase MnmE [Blastocatellia bacterium]
MFADDTIAAVSTPPGRGGIGVVRLSGPASLDIAAKLFRSGRLSPQSSVLSPFQPEPNRALFGHIVDPASAQPIDQIVLTYFKAPRSYTGEDVVELSCHGSPVILRRVLELVTTEGARIAEPGEFTFRAFLNKRIDLAQAQAVRDLINAQTEYQARVATRQLGGELSTRLTPLKEAVVEVIVHLESSIEFVEDDISTKGSTALNDKLEQTIEALHRIAASFSFGRFVKQGFDLAIVGRPNVGKSSVFNRLIGSDRAIVTEVPGTTRDALYESTSISGVPVRLIDTAGIRETSDVVETIGITRSRNAIADADISLLVLDASRQLEPEDLQLLDSVLETVRIVALNKTDLPNLLDEQLYDETGVHFWQLYNDVVSISALTGNGFDELTTKIFERLSGDASAERDDIMLTDARQHAAVQRAIGQLSEARELMIAGELEEIILLKLRAGLEALGEVTGETLTEDILGQIFSTFCIGK